MHEFLVSAAAFIVLIGIMVVVHEFGHFAVAKLCKVRVEAFSFGFGPRLFGCKCGDTDYKVCLLPLGGYVKMTGENFSELSEAATGTATLAPEDDPGAFVNHPRWQRMLIGLAGPVANFILAFVLMVFYFGVINEVPAVEVENTTVEWVVPGSPAALAGIEAGDVLRRFDSIENPTWEEVGERIALNPNQMVPLAVERGGKTLPLALRLPAEPGDQDIVGMLPQYQPGPIGVHEVMPGTPAAKAGLRAGDGILSVNGQPFHTVTTLLAYMQAGQGRPLSLAVVRNGVELAPIVAYPAKLDSGYKLGFAAVPIPYRHDPLSISRAIAKSRLFCEDGSMLVVQMLERMVERKVSVNQLAGPVGIARVAGEAAETKDWYSKFYLAGEISINLGILNLMPFPILDGGMILFLLIESALRRDINVNVKERIYQTAFVFLMVFAVFVIFNDVTKLPIFAHLKP